MKFGTGELLLAVEILRFWLKCLNSTIHSDLHALLRAFGTSLAKYLPERKIIGTEAVEELRTIFGLGVWCD